MAIEAKLHSGSQSTTIEPEKVHAKLARHLLADGVHRDGTRKPQPREPARHDHQHVALLHGARFE